GTVTSVATSFPLTGGTITGSGTISVDTSDAAAALATNDKVRNTDSVGTIVRGTWNATPIDTAYSNGVSMIAGGNGINVQTEGKKNIISADTSQSVAGHALVTHYELNSLDTVGTLSSGVWNAT